MLYRMLFQGEHSRLQDRSRMTLTREEFIARCIALHGPDRFDYSEVVYINSNTDVQIKCRTCAHTFMQLPRQHTDTKCVRWCMKCPRPRSGQKTAIDTQTFIQKATQLHGQGRYDYSAVVYKHSQQKVIIKCLRCNKTFQQKPNSHLCYRGCSSCGHKDASTTRIYHQTKTLQQFIREAQLVHESDYCYDKCKYVNGSIKVIIICNTCKEEFNQTPYTHCRGHGCPNCNRGHQQSSTIAIEWMHFVIVTQNVTIQHFDNGGEYRIPELKRPVDGFDRNNNTVYQFHGDFWHAWPGTYASSLRHPVRKHLTMGQIYEETLRKDAAIKDAGYKLVVMWEHEWKLVRKVCVMLQRQYRSRRSRILKRRSESRIDLEMPTKRPRVETDTKQLADICKRIPPSDSLV